MKVTRLTQFKLPQNYKFWLLGIAISLIIIHLHLTWKSGRIDLMTTSLIFWATVLSLVWKKHETFKLESEIISTCLGLLLILWLLLKSASFVGGNDPLLRLLPFITALGLGLLASGAKGLKQYWQELTLLCFIAIPPRLPLLIVDLPSLTAKFATFILLYLGFDVSRQGVNIILPTGVVEVYPGCAGVNLILELLGLALIFLVMFSTNLSKKVLIFVGAIFIAFIVNGSRVALMAALAHSNKAVFEYWHQGDGSLIFSMVAVVIFGLFCHFLIQDESESRDTEELY